MLGDFHLDGGRAKSAFLVRGDVSRPFSSHLFNLLAQGSTVTLAGRRRISLGIALLSV